MASQTEPARDRRNDRVVAIISIIGAFAVAIVTVLSTIWTTNKTIKSQAAEDRTNFLRQQQQLTYSFIADMHAANNAIDGWLDTLLRHSKAVTAQQRARTAMTQLGIDEANIEIVGSLKTVAQARQAMVTQTTYLDSVLSDLDASGKLSLPAGPMLSLKKSSGDNLTKTLDTFGDSARQDFSNS